MPIEISSLTDSGGWSSSHSNCYSFAYYFRDQYNTCVKLLNFEIMRLKVVHEKEEFRDSYISYLTASMHADCNRNEAAALIFACMAFEGFLNYYGVRRLGEAFHKRFTERIGITEKLACLTGIGFRTIYCPDDQIMTRCRRLFDARNKLVHPKTREIILESFKAVFPDSEPLQDYFDDLEFCIDELCKLDPEINRDFEFGLSRSRPIKITLPVSTK